MITQQWDPDAYERNARFVSALGAEVVALLNPVAGERVLDLGCGDGALTESLVAARCRVIGVDSSPALVAAARARGLDARVQDARALDFDREFDAVFSNAVLHWIPEAGLVLRGVYRALEPGGRFVAELGGAGCLRTVRAALGAALSKRGLAAVPLDPWFFPDVREYRSLLVDHGFLVDSIVLFERPTLLPGDLAAWLETFAQSFLAPFSPAVREEVIADVTEMTRPSLYDQHRGWIADYVRLRFAARRPTETS